MHVIVTFSARDEAERSAKLVDLKAVGLRVDLRYGRAGSIQVAPGRYVTRGELPEGSSIGSGFEVLADVRVTPACRP